MLATVAPTLIVGCPPASKSFGSFGEAALFFVTDAVGSTILAVRPDGSVRNRFLYRPYGQKIVNEGGIDGSFEKLAHGFAAGAIFPVGGGSALYAFGPRLYDPSAGHFYQPDPLLGDPAAPQTMQPYGYALGNTLRLADPTGLFSEGGPVSSPPSFGVPSFRFPSGNGNAKPQPVNKSGNVPPAQDTQQPQGVQLACGPATAVCAAIAIDALGKAAAAATGILLSIGIIDEGSQLLGNVLQQSGDRSLDNPSSLEGATPEEVEEAAREAGFSERGDPPRNDPNGARLRKPGNPADQVRIQSGNPADPNPVKQGPYVRISQGGRVSDPIPLAGNPTLR